MGLTLRTSGTRRWTVNWSLPEGRGRVLPHLHPQYLDGAGVSQGVLLESMWMIVTLCGCVMFHQVEVPNDLTISATAYFSII